MHFWALCIAALACLSSAKSPPRPPAPLQPHMLPQCVKNEPGCESGKLTPGMVMQALDPIHLYVKSIWSVAARRQNHATILLFKPSSDNEHCRGENEANWFGGKKEHKLTIGKLQCKEFKPWPIANMSMNYMTPNNKVDNHCDLTFYDGKQCTGQPVYRINGALELDMINGQSYCHLMHYAKSVQMGPCT